MATSKTQKHPPPSPFSGYDDHVPRTVGEVGVGGSGGPPSRASEPPTQGQPGATSNGLALARHSHGLTGKPGEASCEAWGKEGWHTQTCRGLGPRPTPGRCRDGTSEAPFPPAEQGTAFMSQGKAGRWLAPPDHPRLRRQMPTEWVSEAWPQGCPVCRVALSSISSQWPQE